MNFNLVKITAIAVIVIGILVIIGWYFDIDYLKTIIPGKVTIKSIAAINFVLAGLGLHLTYRTLKGESRTGSTILPILALMILLFSVIPIIATFVGVPSGLGQLFEPKEEPNPYTVAVGRPSIAALLSFILISSVFLLIAFHSKNVQKLLLAAGCILVAVGAVALFGHLIDYPPLFYYFEGKSTGISSIAAVNFVAIGTSLIYASRMSRVEEVTGKKISIKTKSLITFIGIVIIPLLFIQAVTTNNTKLMFERLNELENDPNVSREQELQLIDESENKAMVTTTLVNISTLAIVITISLGFGRSLTRPIHQLSESVQKISEGNYKMELNIHSDDEIASLSDAINKMVEKIIENEITIRTRLDQLQVSTNELRDIHETLDETSLVSITDKDGNITYTNDMFCKVSKYSKDELSGQNHRILKSGYHPPEFYQGLWQTISSGKIWKAEIKNKAKDGSYYWVKTIIMPRLDKRGKPHQYISIRTDITDRKIAEEKLIQARNDIERSERKIKEQFEELQQIDSQKEEFVSMVSHELKTPITVISGYCQLLDEVNKLGKLETKHLGAINAISENADKLNRLVNDVLDVQRLDLGKMNFIIESFETSTLLEELVENMLMFTRQKMAISLGSIDKFTIRSDKERIRQVIMNLVKNSLDFIDETNGRVEVGVLYNGGDAMFYVKDNGKGIPKERQDSLFKKFYQIDTSVRRKHGGAGLGLVICKGIVEALSGKIWFESEEGKGTTFYFTIPKNQDNTMTMTVPDGELT